MMGDRWGAETSPSGFDLQYRVALADLVPTVPPTAVESSKMPGENYVDAFIRLAQSLILTDAQRRLLNVQVQRAQQGLPPLDSSQYGLGVSVGTSPELTRIAWIVGLGALAVFAMSALPRRR